MPPQLCVFSERTSFDTWRHFFFLNMTPLFLVLASVWYYSMERMHVCRVRSIWMAGFSAWH